MRDLTDAEYEEIRNRISYAWWNQVLLRGEPIATKPKSSGSLGRHFAVAHHEVEVSAAGKRSWMSHPTCIMRTQPYERR